MREYNPISKQEFLALTNLTPSMPLSIEIHTGGFWIDNLTVQMLFLIDEMEFYCDMRDASDFLGNKDLADYYDLQADCIYEDQCATHYLIDDISWQVGDEEWDDVDDDSLQDIADQIAEETGKNVVIASPEERDEMRKALQRDAEIGRQTYYALINGIEFMELADVPVFWLTIEQETLLGREGSMLN